jgi:hypothetical protein
VSAANNDFDSGDSGDLKASYITVVRASFGLSASGAVTKFPRVTSLALEPFAENLFSYTTNPFWGTGMMLTFAFLLQKEIVSLYKSGLFHYFQNAWSFFEVFFLYSIFMTFFSIGTYRRGVEEQFTIPMGEDTETPRLAPLFANAMDVRDRPRDAGAQKLSLGPKNYSLSEL